MHEILCTSPQLSATNIFGVREGLGLPEVRRLVDYRMEWDETVDYPWPTIKAEWLKYWDTSRTVLMDKSPPNLVRAIAMQQHFDPASFIVMTRDPYAHSEGMMRRNAMSATAAAGFALQCLRHQKRNMESLERCCLVRYEDLVRDPPTVKQNLEFFLPELQGVVVDRLFTAHHQEHRPLPVTDFNATNIGRLNRDQRLRLNEVFGVEQELLSHFGYSLLQPG